MKKTDKDDDQKRRNDELNQLRIRPVSLSSLPSSCPDCGFCDLCFYERDG